MTKAARFLILSGRLLTVVACGFGGTVGATTLEEAKTLVESRQFYLATAQLSELIDSGALDDADKLEAYLLRGIAATNRRRFPAANADFAQAYALDSGHARAQHWLGIARKYGYGGARDPVEARRLFENASAAGIAEADYELAHMLLSADDKDEAGVAALVRGAERGEPRAMMLLARGHETGQIVEQDAERAFDWFVRAAEAGNPDAQYKVSRAYRFGLGVTVDEEKAKEFLERALEGSAPEAEFAWAYDREVAYDWTEANYYYWRSAESGHTPARVNLGVSFLTGDRGLRQDFRRAFYWLNQARSTVFGAEYTALLLDLGLGVGQDSKAAFALLEPIAARSSTAKSLTAMMLAAGRGVTADSARAAELFAEIEQYESRDDLGSAAWMLATHPDPLARQPELALRLALRAVELDPTFDSFDALAAAYDAAGELELAAQTLERAIAAAENKTDDHRRMLDKRLARLRAGQPRTDGSFDRYEYGESPAPTRTVRAEFVGEIVGLFQRTASNNPRGFDTEIGGENSFGLQIVVQSVEEGSLPHFMRESAVFYIHSPTLFFARLPQDVPVLAAPVGPFRFVLTEVRANGWSYDLAIEPL